MRAPFHAFPYVFLALCLGYYLIFFVLSGAFQHKGLWPAPTPNELWGYVGSPLAPDIFVPIGAGGGSLLLGYLLGMGSARLGRAQCQKFWPIHPTPPAPPFPGSGVLFGLCVLSIVAVALFSLFAIRVPIFYQVLNGALFFLIAVVRHGQITRSAPRALRNAGYGALGLLVVAFAFPQQWTGLFLIVVFLALIEILNGRRQWVIGALILAAVGILYPMKRAQLPSVIAGICSKGAGVDGHASERYMIDVLRKCETNAARRDLLVAALPWARDQILRRISAVRLLDRAWQETPARIPFFAGETLRPLLYTLVPRVLWPDKPRENIGNRIGHAYRVLYPEDMTTSINLPWIVEFYINFDLKGIVLGLGLAGFVLGGVAWLGTVGTRSAVLPPVVVGILFPLAYQESNLSLMIGNALHAIVGAAGLIALAWLLARLRKTPAAASPLP